MYGLLNINKPSGVTSRHVVDVVARLVRPAKAGHAGTLDPLASGVLVVCVGPATRLIEYVQRQPKQYRGTFLLGRESPTEDIEGEVTLLADPPIPTREEVIGVLPRFVGQIEQRPPAFSALKLSGKRAYDLARAGKDVQLEPRTITVERIELVRYEYPELVLDIACGGGTYVRSLGRDIAAAIGTAAVMSSLVRREIGDFRLDDSCQLSELNAGTLKGHLLPATAAVSALPKVALTADQAARVGRGLPIDLPDAIGDEVAALDSTGQLLAILARQPDRRYRAVRNLITDG
ncbi:MAG: tRNA pseudouridine(55) synthase TruB [Planctomycetes bacterium]|nr:tRNA pseudouridine(55) synthase TruB [Planctomycetota bacterium]